MKKIRLIILFTIVLYSSVNAQELPVYSQYILNPYLINPAIAGISVGGVLQIMSRMQWVGIKDAPLTSVVSYHQGFNNVGLGAYVYCDKNGNSSNTGAQFTYAYHISLSNRYPPTSNNRHLLSFGLSLTGVQRKTNESSFLQDGYDPIVTGLKESALIPNANFGIYYTNNNFFTGFSCANLIPITNGVFSTQRIYFCQIGESFHIQRNYILEPSLTTKFDEQLNDQLDVNVKFYLLKYKLWGALSLRNDIGYSFKDGSYTMFVVGTNAARFRIAYAFERGFNAIRSNNYGSHELMLFYNFNDFTPQTCPAYSTMCHKYR